MKIPSWQEVTPGTLVPHPGSSRGVETGSWGMKWPVIDMAKCTHCMICWVYCPDSCFQIQDQRLVGVDYEHCKGCGICALECPKRCIQMTSEVLAAR